MNKTEHLLPADYKQEDTHTCRGFKVSMTNVEMYVRNAYNICNPDVFSL